jgi:hypothetical protein
MITQLWAIREASSRHISCSHHANSTPHADTQQSLKVVVYPRFDFSFSGPLLGGDGIESQSFEFFGNAYFVRHFLFFPMRMRFLHAHRYFFSSRKLAFSLSQFI